jgi:hypothetical protein
MFVISALGVTGFAIMASRPATRLPTFAAGCDGPLTIIGEVAGTMLAAGVTGTCRLFTVLSKIPGVLRSPLVGHWLPLLICEDRDHLIRQTLNGASWIGLYSLMTKLGGWFSLLSCGLVNLSAEFPITGRENGHPITVPIGFEQNDVPICNPP